MNFLNGIFNSAIHPWRRTVWAAVAMALAAVLLAAGCARSPTGRKQLIIVSDGEMNRLGLQEFDRLKKQRPVETDAAVNRYVRCVALAVARQAQDRTGVAKWEIVVFKDPTANAFALPGGKIGVHTGLLKVARTPGQLAAVLGHEVGHVIARHGNERVSQNIGVGMLASVLGGKSKEGEQGNSLVLAALGVGILLPFSRAHEREADRIGQRLMAQAGFDPREAPQLWRNMAGGRGKGPPEILSTHPSSSRRIRELTSHAESALPLYKRARARGNNPQCGNPP